MTSFTLLLSKKLFSPFKNLPAIFTNSKQSKTPFGRNSVTYGTPCHARGHFAFLLSPCYVEDTMPHQWSFSDLPWALRIWESVFYSPAFFTLPSFPTFGTTCFYQGFPGSRNSSLKVAGPPINVQNTDSPLLFVWITQCSSKSINW